MKLENVLKSYVSDMGNQVKALNLISYKFELGKFYAIMGESGAGKSTLINILGLIDKPTSGKIFIDNIDTSKLTNDEVSKMRNRLIGFVFQNFYLNNRLTALENVLLPTFINKSLTFDEAKKRAISLFLNFNVKDRVDHFPYELSGGEQQRVALARALINDPKFILADEPTGNLDSKNEQEIFCYLKNECKKGKCVIVVTHNVNIMNFADEILYLNKGVLDV